MATIKAIQCLQRMEQEGELRRWTLYKDERTKTDALEAWKLLRIGLRREVSDFNEPFENSGKDAPLAIDDQDAIIIIRREKYPLHETQIMLELPQRRFMIYRKSAPDGITAPTETHEVVKLDLGADDKLYLEYNDKRYGAFQLPHEVMKKVFAAMPRP